MTLHVLLLFLLTTLGLLNTLGCSARSLNSASASAGSQRVPAIVVYANIPLSTSSRDDLELLRGYYRGASWEWALDPPTWGFLRHLRFNRLRLINIGAGSLVPNPDAPHRVDFVAPTRLAEALSDCTKYHLKPHVVVGHHPIPPYVRPSADSGHFSLTDRAGYADYAYRLLRYIAVERGIRVFDVEVGNEPDLNGERWLLPQEWPLASEEMYTAYLDLYELWSKAVVRLVRENPELRIRIGGPAVSSYSFAFGHFNWIQHFLKDVAARKLDLDFVSLHVYGNTAPLSVLAVHNQPSFPSLASQIRQTRGFVLEAGLQGLPIYLTELGPTYHTDDSPQGAANGTHVGAAWTVEAMMALAELGVEEAMQLVIRNHAVYPSAPGNDNWNWPAYLSLDGHTPKALYNVFSMFEMLPGKRVLVRSRLRSGGAIASVGPASAGVLAYRRDSYLALDAPSEGEISVVLRELPIAETTVHIRRYLVDREHSNAHRPAPDKALLELEHAKLQLVEDYVVAVRGGYLQLRPVALEPHSVTLWLVAANDNALSE